VPRGQRRRDRVFPRDDANALEGQAALSQLPSAAAVR
jgi:hypothetical protein